MKRKFQFVPGEFYHIYNRGTDKRNIFSDVSDYRRFLALLYLCNSTLPVELRSLLRQGPASASRGGRALAELFDVERGKTLVDIGAYCPMPNHFHLLLHEHAEGGVSKFMQKLSTAYSMYFNTKYERTGGLFEGRFKARHANTDNYLKYLFAYIHLNPVKLIDPDWKENGIVDRKKAKEFLKTYHHSSYLDYMGQKRPENVILNKDPFPEYFEDVKEFDDFITDWLTYNDDENMA